MPFITSNTSTGEDVAGWVEGVEPQGGLGSHSLLKLFQIEHWACQAARLTQ